MAQGTDTTLWGRDDAVVLQALGLPERLINARDHRLGHHRRMRLGHYGALGEVREDATERSCRGPRVRAHRGTGAQGHRGRLATSICRLRHDRMEQAPTEPHAGRSTFLLSSGGAGGGYY